LGLLELVQQQYMRILSGEGRNNFIIEWNEERAEENFVVFSMTGPSLN
jgi:segregation and condensation protein A